MIDYKYEINNLYTNIYNKSSNSVTLNIELNRSKIINELTFIFKTFIKKISNNNKIFLHNKIDEYVQRWCWLQPNNLNDLNNLNDYVVPYINTNDYDFDDFIDFIKYNLEIELNNDNKDFVQLKNDIIIFLENSNNILLDLYNTNIENNNLTFIEIKKINNNNNIILIYNNNKLYVSIELYTKLVDKFINNNNNNNNNIDIYIYYLLFRYSYIESGNQQLAINEKIKYMFKEHGVNFELYGSAINTTSNNYCSLYFDIEKYFGSKGNFFHMELYSGIYWCNPPYCNTILTKTAIKILNILNNLNNKNICFIITIPIWDKKTQNSINNYTYVQRNNNNNTNILEYNDYLIYYLLKSYIKDELIIPKYRIPYFNYRLNKYIYAVDTYMLIIYNDNDKDKFIKLHNIFDLIIDLDKNNYFII
jgi:hypothetical protein